MRSEKVEQETWLSDATNQPVFRRTVRDGVVSERVVRDGKFVPLTEEHEALLMARGASSADVQPAAPEAEAPTVVSPAVA